MTLNISGMMKKPMMQNFVSLVLLQGINYLLPLLTFPFLFRVLEVKYFGLVSFGYTLTQFFVIFTDFGFNLSATKYISINRDNREAVNKYLNSVFVCRALLAAASFLILLLLACFVERFKHDSWFYISYFGIVIGNALFPMWYFQGMEKMKYITAFNIIAKSVSFLPLFIFIREPGDYILAPVFYSAGYILAGLISVYVIYFREDMQWFLPAVKDIAYAFSDSFSYFLSRISLSMFSNINTFVIGLLCGNTAVGYYSAAEKLYLAYNQLLLPFTGVLFPHIAKTRDVRFFKRILSLIAPINIALLAIILLGSQWLIDIIYDEPAQSGTLAVFRILICASFLAVPSILLGYPFLAAMGHARYTNYTVVLVSIFHITGLAALVLSNTLSIYSVAALVVLSETLLFAFRAAGVKKYRLL
ncbi:MAG: oligosaccharide flippase family protein [Tannerellaceae bacterium]|jgi:PST family polysaccharide transporter|nr:oligosaccharide flippase family protein [Tannerellaceae bacterium]